MIPRDNSHSRECKVVLGRQFGYCRDGTLAACLSALHA